ncbi:hypothetical protein SSPIM334S_07921 [Streptomyces spiroverticillatus]|uniref:hypothetical protein n=1 Tax=Streptomyces finlayi TaxID=67296 RepID=UPI001676CF05|nr:hypothetical protein [Streptomyces finlayi]
MEGTKGTPAEEAGAASLKAAQSYADAATKYVDSNLKDYKPFLDVTFKARQDAREAATGVRTKLQPAKEAAAGVVTAAQKKLDQTPGGVKQARTALKTCLGKR